MIQNEQEFTEFAKANRLRLRRDQDGTPVVRSRQKKGQNRGHIVFVRPGLVAIVVIGVTRRRSRSLSRHLERLGVLVNYVQGGPPGEWVAEFFAIDLLRVAKALGMVKKINRNRSGRGLGRELAAKIGSKQAGT